MHMQVHTVMRVVIFRQDRLLEQRRNSLVDQVQMLCCGWHERQAAKQHRSLNETQRCGGPRELEILLASGAELTQNDIMRLHAVRDNFFRPARLWCALAIRSARRSGF